jgi:hypothetical protein
MQFLQRSIYNKNSYCECEQNKATHFRDPDDGNIRPISELVETMADNTTQVFIRNVPTSSNDKLPEPLPMPVMNFGEPDHEIEQNEGLPLPSMTFNAPSKKQEKVTANDDVDYLPLPVMKF